MIRFAIVLLIAALSKSVVASGKRVLEIQVIDVEIGLNDFTDRPTLCLVSGREVSSGRLVGVIEDIMDCHYARQAKKNPGKVMRLPGQDLTPVREQEMLTHLQAFDSQLEFFWSSAD